MSATARQSASRTSRAIAAMLAILLIGVPSLRAAEAKAPPTPNNDTANPGTVVEALPAGTKLIKLEAHPAAIELRHRFDYRQLLLTGVTAAGDRIDVTRMAKLAAPATDKPSAIVSVNDNRLVRVAADGNGELKFTIGEQSVVVPVKVSGVVAEHAASFVREVNPMLSKLGCNAGTCHGGAQGKNGFKLSLRGYDPLFDHRSLTDDLAGRRFNRAAPEQSLMLLKPSGAVPHVGGVLTKTGEPGYELLKLWIAQGSKFDPDSSRVKKVEVLPSNPVIPLPGMKQQMTVMATFSDGTVRDVTAEAFVESGNIEVTEVTKQGVVTALRRGESAVLVRYEGAYAATTITVMGDRTGFAWADQTEHNYIDKLVYDKLKKVKTLPSELSSDVDFLRRVYIDLTGLPPTVDQVRGFLADTRDTKLKRDELIDKLVGSAEYVEHWTNRWADLLQVNNKFLGEQGSWAFRNWIRQAVAVNKPYDQFVHDVLTASGSNLENPPASYYKILRAPDAVMENTTQLFLGVRFNCNKCHDHPFERWTQDQHWQLAAYFAKVGRKEDPQFADKKIGGSAVENPVSLVEIIYDGNSGDVKHPTTNAVQNPSFPYQHDLAKTDRGPREQFADWTTSPENEYFAKSYVNRLWSYLLGVGFIEPIDDIRAGNPATNAELLDRLTREFIDRKFDTQHMLRLICKSRVYQHSIVPNRWNEDDGINYSHAIARRLPAEVLFDAVHQATGSVRRLPGMPAGSRAAQQRDSGVNNADGFLDLFGRPARESACECERVGGVMLGQTLNLINGPTVAQAISDGGNEIGKLVAKEQDDNKVVQELFLRVLSRPATDQELRRGVAALNAEDDGLQKAKQALATHESQLPSKQAAWEKEIAAFSWVPVEAVTMKSTAGAEFAKESDHSILVSGKLSKDVYTITANSELPNITGIRLEVLADARLPGGGPGRAENGNLVVNELRLSAGPKSSNAKETTLEPVQLQNALADFSQNGYVVAGAIDGDVNTGWALQPNNATVVGKSRVATFETKTDIKFEGGATLSFTLDQQYQDGKHNIGKFRLSVTNGRRPLMLTGPPEQVAAIVAVPLVKRTPEQRAELEKYYRSIDGELTRLQNGLSEASKLDVDKRLAGAQDLVWALINSPAFLFNR